MSTKILALLLVAVFAISATTVFAWDLVRYCKNNPMQCIKWCFNNPDKLKAYCDANPQKCKKAFDYLVNYCKAHKTQCKDLCFSHFDKCKAAYNWVCNNYPGLTICGLNF